MLVGKEFLSYVDGGPGDIYPQIGEFRLVHQDSCDLRSWQIIDCRYDLHPGWTVVEYEVDRGEGQLTDG